MSSFQAVLRQLRLKHNLTQDELASKLGVSKSTVSMYENGNREPDFETMEAIADFFNVDMDFLLGRTDYTTKIVNETERLNATSNTTAVRINVLGSVPAGVPIEAIEDIVDWEEIPVEWVGGGREYFGLKVHGDSMYPKYLEGDTIIVRHQEDCESGDDCVVYVNGYDATLKKVVKKSDHIILQPLNSKYDPVMYEYNDEEYPVTITGVVVEIRRKV